MGAELFGEPGNGLRWWRNPFLGERKVVAGAWAYSAGFAVESILIVTAINAFLQFLGRSRYGPEELVSNLSGHPHKGPQQVGSIVLI